MLNINFNKYGCLAGILILLFLTFLFKFWFIILVGLIIMIIFSKLKNIVKTNFQTGSTFNSKVGEVYKQCIYCDTKAERSAKVCKSCGRPFE